jgi:hypothetical protein
MLWMLLPTATDARGNAGTMFCQIWLGQCAKRLVLDLVDGFSF